MMKKFLAQTFGNVTKCIMHHKVFTFLLVFLFTMIFAILFAGVGALSELNGDMGYIEHYAQENDIVAVDGQDLESLVKDHIAEHNEPTVIHKTWTYNGVEYDTSRTIPAETYDSLKETYIDNLSTKEKMIQMFTGNCAIIGAAGGAICGALVGLLSSRWACAYVNNDSVALKVLDNQGPKANTFFRTVAAGELVFGNGDDVIRPKQRFRKAYVQGKRAEVQIKDKWDQKEGQLRNKFTRKWGHKMRNTGFAWTLLIMFLGSLATLGAVYTGHLQAGVAIGLMAATGVVVIIAAAVTAAVAGAGCGIYACAGARRLVASNDNKYLQNIATVTVCALIIFIAVSRRIRRSARTRESNLMQIVLID